MGKKLTAWQIILVVVLVVGIVAAVYGYRFSQEKGPTIIGVPKGEGTRKIREHKLQTQEDKHMMMLKKYQERREGDDKKPAAQKPATEPKPVAQPTSEKAPAEKK